MATGKAKTIDEIDNMKEMFDVMEALEISCPDLQKLDEMKSRAKSEFGQLLSISRWTAGEAFSVLSKIKDEDAKVKEFLLSFYREVETCYDDLDDNIQTLLKKKMGNVKEKMKSHQIKMKKEDYYLLVAGETGSGKTSLINLILGEELLPFSILSNTSTICELKYGEERRIVAHFKDKDLATPLPTKTFNLVEPQTSQKSYLEQISPFIQSGREKGSIYKKVELYWPHQLLKNGVVIIDSPGVGDSEIMDEIVTEYLPEAFAFTYFINCTNAGGVQKDRLGKLLEGVKEKRKEEEFTSTCALLVCNKWDQVKETKEEEKVENHVIEKLKKFYPHIVPEKQIVQMSTKNARIAQNYGIITKRFFSLMNWMRSMVLRSVKARLEFYWRWLYELLSQIVYHAKAHVKNATRDQEEILKLITTLRTRLSCIEEKKNEVMEDLRTHLEGRTKDAVKNLSNYRCSDAIKSRFTSWTSDEVPKAFFAQ